MPKAKSCGELLEEFRASRASTIRGEKLIFAGVGNKDVYNITAPVFLPMAGRLKRCIVGRVENRNRPLNSRIMFFEEANGGNTWQPIIKAPVFKGEDPYVAIIGGEIVLHYVKAYNPEENPKIWHYQTVFCKGKDILSLEKFMIGPPRMKDIRLLPLKSGNIGIFTRPEGGSAARGTIGYTAIAGLGQLSVKVIKEARLLTNMFQRKEWGGANDPFCRTDGLLGFVGHIAGFDDSGKKNYFAIMIEEFDPKTFEFSQPRIIAARDMFPPGEAKRPDLENVVFPGGLEHKEGKTWLYCGLSDVESGRIEIKIK